MGETIEMHKCDICGSAFDWKKEGWVNVSLTHRQFTMDDTTGKTMGPYVHNIVVNLCGECLSTAVPVQRIVHIPNGESVFELEKEI